MRWTPFGLVVGLVLMAPATAFAVGPCALQFGTFVNPTMDPPGGYDPFASSSNVNAQQFTLVKSNGKTCNFFVTFSQGGGTSSGIRSMSGSGGNLNYDFFVDSQMSARLMDVPQAQSQNVLTGNFSSQKNQTKTFTYYSYVPPGQILTAGSYSDSITVSVYEGSVTGSKQLDDTQTISVASSVRSSVNVTFSQGGGAVPFAGTTQTIEFGTLQTGASRSFSLNVQANAPYSLSIQSDNKGVMKNASASANNTVPYTMTLNGASLGLGGTVIANFGKPSGTAQQNFNVTIGDISQSVSGDYSDSLTLSVTAN